MEVRGGLLRLAWAGGRNVPTPRRSTRTPPSGGPRQARTAAPDTAKRTGARPAAPPPANQTHRGRKPPRKSTRAAAAPRTIDEPIALENRRMPRVLEMRDPVDAREDNKEEAPRFARGVEPGARDCPVQRRIRPHVMRRRAQDGAAENETVAAGTQSADQGRADRDAFRDEVEERRSRSDVAVEPAGLYAAVAAGGSPLRAPSPRSTGSIEPANARDSNAAGIAAEQERDVRDTCRGGKNRRAGRETAGLDDPAGEIGEIAAPQ